MICQNGHGFDLGSGHDGLCPVCGTRLKRKLTKAKLYDVTRADLLVIRDGLRAATTVVKCATKIWPEASDAEQMIARAYGRLESVMAMAKYARRNKS